MEETNNTNIPNQSVETPIIQTPTPKQNIYKYLFLVSIFVLLTVIVSFYFVLNNKNSQPSDNNISQITPSVIPTEEIINEVTPTTIVKTKVSYKAVSIQDDENSISKFILIDQNDKEIIIKESKYWGEPGGFIAKPNYYDFIFSSDNNFLYYREDSGWESSYSFIYDILNKKVIDLGFPADTKGFSPDSKYFYACAEGGMMSGGAVVKELNSLKNILSSNEGDSYKCQYNKSTGEVAFSEFDPFSYEGKTVLSQYKFSEKTGSLTKIK